LGSQQNDAPATGPLAGLRVSGSSIVKGRARRIDAAHAETGAPIPDLEEGDIIVSPIIHQAWLPYFKTAGGLVSEIGGWLSHTAIIAREFDLAMIVGVQALDSIESGALIELRLDGSISIISAQTSRDAGAIAAE
jgi:phosphohistidine swiveling domain-containing protein